MAAMRSAVARTLTADREIDASVVTDKGGVRDVGRRCVVARTLRVHLHSGVDGVADAPSQPVRGRLPPAHSGTWWSGCPRRTSSTGAPSWSVPVRRGHPSGTTSRSQGRRRTARTALRARPPSTRDRRRQVAPGLWASVRAVAKSRTGSFVVIFASSQSVDGPHVAADVRRALTAVLATTGVHARPGRWPCTPWATSGNLATASPETTVPGRRAPLSDVVVGMPPGGSQSMAGPRSPIAVRSACAVGGHRALSELGSSDLRSPIRARAAYEMGAHLAHTAVHSSGILPVRNGSRNPALARDWGIVHPGAPSLDQPDKLGVTGSISVLPILTDTPCERGFVVWRTGLNGAPAEAGAHRVPHAPLPRVRAAQPPRAAVYRSDTNAGPS